MARRFITVCDWHEQTLDETVEIPSDKLYGIDGTWYRIGICDADKKELTFTELEEFIVEHGLRLKNGELPDDMQVKPAGKAKVKTTGGRPTAQESALFALTGIQCMYCPTKSKNDKSLAQHMRNIHGFRGTSDSFGSTCPLDNTESGNLAQHAMKTHDLTGLTALFEEAERQGDPHGVVAAAKARTAAP